VTLCAHASARSTGKTDLQQHRHELRGRFGISRHHHQAQTLIDRCGQAQRIGTCDCQHRDRIGNRVGELQFRPNQELRTPPSKMSHSSLGLATLKVIVIAGQ